MHIISLVICQRIWSHRHIHAQTFSCLVSHLHIHLHYILIVLGHEYVLFLLAFKPMNFSQVTLLSLSSEWTFRNIYFLLFSEWTFRKLLFSRFQANELFVSYISRLLANELFTNYSFSLMSEWTFCKLFYFSLLREWAFCTLLPSPFRVNELFVSYFYLAFEWTDFSLVISFSLWENELLASYSYPNHF